MTQNVLEFPRVGLARMFTESLTPRPELENNQETADSTDQRNTF
jgi:hypothetical protein